jgi:hypothetical protein
MVAIISVSSSPNSEFVAKSCGYSTSEPLAFLGVFVFGAIAVFFADRPECGESLFYGGVAHSSGVQCPMEIAG